MINFFRKIRKQLADDNKPLKYMRYAIGEIVLVVIGILIALSINNWNEEQKKSNREARILRSLKSELMTNLLELKSDYEFHKLWVLLNLSIFPIKFVQTIVYMYFPLLTKLFYYENY